MKRLVLTAMVLLTAPAMAQTITERADQLLLADPASVIQIRRSIQQAGAAKQAPVVEDFSDSFSQEVLDLEDMFEISMEPDQVAPEIFLARYQSTAISFVDAYGNPWPIRRISNFLAGLIQIEKATPDNGEEGGTAVNDPQAGSFTMTALKHGVVGNITVYLKDLPTQISIKLVDKGSMYHRIATLKISDAGPQTDIASIYSGQGVKVGVENDADLNNALYGVSPLGSEQMVVEGAEGKAWLKGEYLYLQTNISVFSPRIVRTAHSNGKYRAYKLPRTTTVMGTGPDGKTLSVKIKRHPSAAIAGSSATLGVR